MESTNSKIICSCCKNKIVPIIIDSLQICAICGNICTLVDNFIFSSNKKPKKHRKNSRHLKHVDNFNLF